MRASQSVTVTWKSVPTRCVCRDCRRSRSVATTAMTEIAIEEMLDGRAWLEHVPQEQYEGWSGGS